MRSPARFQSPHIVTLSTRTVFLTCGKGLSDTQHHAAPLSPLRRRCHGNSKTWQRHELAKVPGTVPVAFPGSHDILRRSARVGDVPPRCAARCEQVPRNPVCRAAGALRPASSAGAMDEPL